MSTTEAPSPTDVRCPRCGAELADEQEWCLECGSEVVRAGGPASRRGGSGRRGAKRWLALGGGLGIVAAVVVVVLLLGQGVSSETKQAPPTAQKLAAPSTNANTATSPKAQPTRGSDVPIWPEAEQAYTVVLLSTASQESAEAKVRPLLRGGADVGILRSDDYEGFRPGSWVVWRGRYQRLFKAEEALTILRQSGRSGEIKSVRRRGQPPATGEKPD